MDNSLISNRLKEQISTRGISALELARRANVKPSFIYDILHGKSVNPSPIKLTRVAEALGTNIAQLIGSNETSFPAPPSSEYVVISTVLVENKQEKNNVVTVDQQGEPYYFRQSWITDRLGAQPDNLRMLFVHDDSMAPTLCEGDMALLDITKTSPSPPGIFVIFDGHSLVTKRLESLVDDTSTATIRISSDNTRYESYERSAGDLQIIGRVVWFAREM